MAPVDSELTPTQWPEGNSDVPLQPVKRLIYASVSNVQGSAFDEMRRIREHAVVRNQALGIRVALLYMCGWFVEWIEGPAPSIQDLMHRVSQDTRHHGLKVIHRSVGQPRLFRPWIGSIVQTNETPTQFAQRVFAQHERFASGEVQEPASVWLGLCSPPDADMPMMAANWPRVMLLSARGAQGFDLLEWLARETQRKLVRRRFAGAPEDGGDVESDYLDLPAHGTRGLRLLANARKGLAMGMTHAFLPDYAAIVVLLHTDLETNLRIIERVLGACRQVHHMPAIVGLGTHATVRPELKELVERQGVLWIGAPSRMAMPELSDLWETLDPVLEHLDAVDPDPEP